MENNKIYYERLMLLAEHLEAGKLFNEYIPSTLDIKDSPIVQIDGHEHIAFFRFIFYEIVELFPGVFQETENGLRLIGTDIYEPFCIASFFGLEPMETFHLFSPMLQSPHEFGGERLAFNATPQSIGRNMKVFLNQINNKIN